MIAFLDACVVIYWIEMKEPQYQQLADKLHALRKKYPSLSFAVSELSLLECRVKPMREKNEDLLKMYHRFFAARDLALMPLSLDVIEQATLLRARYNVATPDALQAASALSISEEVIFVTGDSAFKKVPNLNVVIV